MPIWTNTVPQDPRGPAFQIVRTPAYKPLIAIVTCLDLVGCYTHYYHGRTVPCEGADCPAHKDGIPFRWHAYLSAFNSVNGQHFLFECTAQAAEAFTDYRDTFSTLRGCLFRATRMNQKTNGRIVIQTKPADLTKVKIPKPPDLTKCLAILWSLPIPDVQAETINPRKKTPQITPKKTP